MITLTFKDGTVRDITSFTVFLTHNNPKGVPCIEVVDLKGESRFCEYSKETHLELLQALFQKIE